MDYDSGLYRNYVEGRALTPGTRALWLGVVREYLPEGANTVLDLGCGTGRFAAPMAKELGVRVVGVEPARRMLAAAPRCVRRIRGRAERIPLSDRACDFAFLSMVVHHLADLLATVSELRRVVRPGGRVMVRNCFAGRMRDICFFRFSEAALRAEDARMPAAEAVEEAFADGGFTRLAFRTVMQQTDDSLAEHLTRMRKRAMSTFSLMTEAEIEEGLAAMEAAVRAEPAPRPVVEPIDVLVFG